MAGLMPLKLGSRDGLEHRMLCVCLFFPFHQCPYYRLCKFQVFSLFRKWIWIGFSPYPHPGPQSLFGCSKGELTDICYWHGLKFTWASRQSLVPVVFQVIILMLWIFIWWLTCWEAVCSLSLLCSCPSGRESPFLPPAMGISTSHWPIRTNVRNESSHPATLAMCCAFITHRSHDRVCD